ncbi:hypothetical protein N0V90_007178 [Kalmusia sp. IMI 367209]|nr:hypothetical protein N0V90_007178 [Kalmusia sp. IMI 367209]
MAPSHVPAEQHPLQGQTMYTNSPYQNIYAVDQYGAQPWDGQLAQHASLVPDNTPTQAWHHNAYPTQPYNQISQPYVNQTQAHRTASPYQYSQFGNHAPQNNYGHASNVDPSLGVDPNVMRQQQQSPYQIGVQNAPPQSRANTVTPQSLQQGLPVQDPRTTTAYQIPKPTADSFAQRTVSPAFAQPVANPNYEVPKGRKSGGFVILDQAALAKATNSNALNKLVTLGSEPFHLPSNRTALPLYTPRQSVKDLKKVGADSKKLAKRSPSKQLSTGKVIKREASDSESYDDSSEDDSDYSDAEEEDQSPLPATKPEEPQAAFRYDIIKATWYPRQSQPSSEKIKTSLRDLWEIFNTIQKRWRIDSKAVMEAEEQKKTGELPVLKRRVAEQRDLLQSALKSALEFSHPDVLYHLGQVKGFLYLCYQFLANRFKTSDYDGPLPSAIIEMLSRCLGTITSELLEETKLVKALNVMKKNANDENKARIKQIEEGAAAGSKKAKGSSPPAAMDVTSETKAVKRPATQPAGRTSAEGPAKKLKPTEPSTNGDKKSSTSIGVSKNAPTLQQKRPVEKLASIPTKARGTQIVNRPSSLFASLNAAGKKPTGVTTSASTAKPVAKPAVSASKDKKPAAVPTTKPAFSFADTMKELLKDKEEKAVVPSKTEKQLPPETPEEKAKRLRKESRRHLRVKFRPGDALVSIKYFNHHPEEETGHDENFVRDAGDVGGEGRMFKQHKDMDDEDDDEDMEMEYRPWKAPSLVDFSVINPDERKRNYAPYGGGECQPICPEREANIAHENTTLMVVYQHPSDIPKSPREPLLQTETSNIPVTSFGPPPQLVLDRLPKSTTITPAPVDISNILEVVKQMGNPLQSTASQASYAPPQIAAAPPAAPPVVPDLKDILSVLGQNPSQVPVPPTQAPAAPPMDLSAIIAMAQQFVPTGNANFPQPPPLPSWPGFPPVVPQQQQPDMSSTYQNQQAQHSQHNRAGHKRQRDDGAETNERGSGSGKRNKGDKAQHFGGRPHKVVLCKFFQKGLCSKGDDCTFIHEQQ